MTKETEDFYREVQFVQVVEMKGRIVALDRQGRVWCRSWWDDRSNNGEMPSYWELVGQEAPK